MIRLPPRSTRTYTLFPYTTLFRSCLFGDIGWITVGVGRHPVERHESGNEEDSLRLHQLQRIFGQKAAVLDRVDSSLDRQARGCVAVRDRKSTRLNSSH